MKKFRLYALTYPAFLFLVADILAQFQIGCDVHIFTDSEQRLQTIVLCNVAGHTTECGCTESMKVNSFIRVSFQYVQLPNLRKSRRRPLVNMEPSTPVVLKPESASNKVDLPAPDGPIIAIN